MPVRGPKRFLFTGHGGLKKKNYSVLSSFLFMIKVVINQGFGS